MPKHRLRAAVAALVSAATIAFACAPASADIVGTVRGTLERANRQAVPDATVTLAGTGVALTATTDAGGHFAFPRVPFGTYTLRASTPDGPVERSVDVSTDAVVELELQPAQVIGTTAATTTGVHGTPVAEETVTASQIATLPANTTIDRVIETLPGVVRFSYDEPVVDGFHGITYELDGAPLPSSTSSNFANLIDPREAGAIEVFTGAFPAEFGGQRMGAVVNVRSLSFSGPPPPGVLILGGGSLGTEDGELIKQFDVGRAQVSVALDNLATDRGLDTPTENAIHDASSTTNQFVRIALPLDSRDTLAIDAANQYATYEIPINANPADVTAGEVELPGQDDVQREYDRFLALSFTRNDADGNGYFRVVPWTRYNRVVYDGDLAQDVQGYLIGTAVTPQTCPVNTPTAYDCPLNGLFQDRAAAYVGLRVSKGRTFGDHTLTYGIDAYQEDFHSADTIAFNPAEEPAGLTGPFYDDSAQRGTESSAYVEDVWTPNQGLAIKPGLRYDHSTGYVSGGQLSPRFEVDQTVAPGTVAHAYIGRYYAAPGLEDTRREAYITDTTSNAAPVYDLQPERDTLLEVGLAHDFGENRRAFVDAYDRTVVNVLDTTNLLNTPLFAVYNSAIGVTRGIEGRYQQSSATSDVGISFTYSRSLAAGVSGGTFLFPPGPDITSLTLEPEDHDETYVGDAYLTRHLGGDRKTFATLETQYGSGFPVAFLDGTAGRLPAHFQENVALGRMPVGKHLGYELTVDNLLDHRWLIKVQNGFNTTQWNAPERAEFRLLLPI